MRNIDVFVAFQFNKAKMPRSEREAAIQQAVDVVRHELPDGRGIMLRWSSFDLESPGYVFPQIKEQISKAAIFVADISELNLNVILETGYALGLTEGSSRVPILLCHEDVDVRQVPSDLLGMYFYRYGNDSFRHVLQREIKRALERYIAGIEREEMAQIGLPDFWGYKDGADVDIVCSELPLDDVPYYASPDDRNYLRYGKFADLDSTVHLHTNLVRLFPSVRIREFTATEHHNTDYNGLILIGGPAWNSKFRIFQDHLPICFEDRPDEPDDVLVILDSHRKPVCEYKPRISEGGGIVGDVSVVARISDIGGRSTFLFAGSLTLGVLGACKVFLSRGCGVINSRFVMDRVGFDDFVIVFGSDYRGHEVMAPRFDIRMPMHFFQRKIGYPGEFVEIRS